MPDSPVLQYPVINGLVATGTNQAGALQLQPISSFQQFSTVGSGTGAILPVPLTYPLQISIVNGGSNALAIYPQVGGTIDNGSVNASVNATAGKTLTLEASSPTNWYTLSNTASAGGTGTVTSVTFTGDGTVLSSTPSSAVTTTGTVTAALATQAKNVVLSGPASGSNAAPTFRAIVNADLPAAGSSGQLQYNSSGLFAAAADLAVGSSGQLNLTPIAAPGSPVLGDMWVDSTQNCIVHFGGGATTGASLSAYRSGLLYAMTGSPITFGTTGSNSLLSGATGVGTLTFPAGYLNVLGRTIRIKAIGYMTTGSSPGNQYFFVKLGSNVISTGQAVALTASHTTNNWEAHVTISVKTAGSSGKLDTFGTLSLGMQGSAFLWGTAPQFQNGTAAGTSVPGTQVTLDLTAGYTLDFQNNFSATTNTNTIWLTNFTVEVLG